VNAFGKTVSNVIEKILAQCRSTLSIHSPNHRCRHENVYLVEKV